MSDKQSEREPGFGSDGEPFESIPFWEDVWDRDPETGEQEWVDPDE